ncbi:MAG: OmpA family protein [Desulfobacterales bacterium]|jgi:chemotaxis protein MotB
MKRYRQNNETGTQNSSGWLTTFNDLVTLLMVFFVLLFSMSSISAERIQDIQYALQSGLGILKEGQMSSVSVKDTQPIKDMSHISTQAEGVETEKRMDQHGISDTQALESLKSELGIRVIPTGQGTRLSLENRVLFDFGKAAINPEGFSLLDKIAAAIKKMPYPVRVEGHTDNVPIRTKKFPSNWELSVARAVNVVKYFAAVSKIDPQRLSAVGYGEIRPVVPNDTPSNRAVNRRVEIILVTEGKKENVK